MVSWPSLAAFVRREFAHLAHIQPSDRHWTMPFAAALASGAPLLIGAYFGHMAYGLVSSLGGMVFLYLPATSLQHRMVWLMACAFGMVGCYTLGLLSHLLAPLLVPVLIAIAALVMMAVRLYGIGAPGGLFFIMSTAIGAYTPVTLVQFPTLVGLNALGSLLACLVAFGYSLYTLQRRAPLPAGATPAPGFDVGVADPVISGAFVGVALLVAQLLQMPRPYWVPVSCLAVMQGTSLRAVWNKQLQRILGTVAGVGLAWVCLWPAPGPWAVALLVMALTFCVETLVVRHYGSAVVFITPLTILLADAADLGSTTPAALMQARLLDTVLGALIGLLGGFCLHDARLRAPLVAVLRRLVPSLARP